MEFFALFVGSSLGALYSLVFGFRERKIEEKHDYANLRVEAEKMGFSPLEAQVK